MTDSVRERLLALQHVAERPDGTLDLWTPRSGNSQDRMEFRHGRFLGAMWVQFLQGEEAASCLYAHLCEVQIEAVARRCPIALGFKEEIARTLLAAPRDASPAMVAIPRVRYSRDPGVAMRQLPWVRETPTGLDPFCIPLTGEYHQDLATGRHFGAVLVDLIQQTGWVHVLGTRGKTPPEFDAVMTGMYHVVAEVIQAAPEDCTTVQRAARAC